MTTQPRRPRAWVSWSSGKDCAYALHTVRSQGAVEVVGLLTTLNASADRVSMHGVRRELLHAQAAALGLPLHVIELPDPCPNGVYERRMRDAVSAARQDGVTRLVYGDLLLADVRAYREQALAGTGITPMFPLWGRATSELARQLLTSGVRAVLTCVDSSQAPAELAGRWYDEQLLRELPQGVDHCGERGEFHTFVVDAPGFAGPLDVSVGEVVERSGFVFADVLPGWRAPSAEAPLQD